MLKHVAANPRAAAQAVRIPFRLGAGRRLPTATYATHSQKTNAASKPAPAKATKTKSNADQKTPPKQLPSKSPNQPNVKPLLTFQYEPHPGPINVCTWPSTKIFLADSSHPLYWRHKLRAKDFDPKVLIWAVRCPIDVSKKSVYRHQVQKKVRKAFVRELEKQGWDEKGRVLVEEKKDVSGERQPPRGLAQYLGRLSGALCVVLSRDKESTLLAGQEEIENEVQFVLRKMVRLFEEAGKNSRSQMSSKLAVKDTGARFLGRERRNNPAVGHRNIRRNLEKDTTATSSET